jgi:large conductance mechanosensitive channel
MPSGRRRFRSFAYGSFLTILVNFIILAFIIFIMIKQVNRLKRTCVAGRRTEAAPPLPAEDVLLLREIRDSLRK